MAQKPSEVDIAYDWELWIGRTVAETTTFTQIFGLEGLAFPQQVPESEDVTHMQSPGRTRETISGLMPEIDSTFEKQLWNDAGDDILDALATQEAAGTKEEVLIEFHIPGESRRTYRGRCDAFNPTGTVGSKAMVSVGLKINERVTNTRVIPA